MNNACSGMHETAVCCQNLLLRNRNSHILLTIVICAPFAKFGLFLNTPTKLSRQNLNSLVHLATVEYEAEESPSMLGKLS